MFAETSMVAPWRLQTFEQGTDSSTLVVGSLGPSALGPCSASAPETFVD
jgi:hypothetical protein